MTSNGVKWECSYHVHSIHRYCKYARRPKKDFFKKWKGEEILRSLPKDWRPKRTTIEEAKDLNTLSYDNLIGLLISYKENLAIEKGHKDKKKKNVILKASRLGSNEESALEIKILQRLLEN